LGIERNSILCHQKNFFHTLRLSTIFNDDFDDVPLNASSNIKGFSLLASSWSFFFRDIKEKWKVLFLLHFFVRGMSGKLEKMILRICCKG
jgi:hypothetical protein